MRRRRRKWRAVERTHWSPSGCSSRRARKVPHLLPRIRHHELGARSARALQPLFQRELFHVRVPARRLDPAHLRRRLQPGLPDGPAAERPDAEGVPAGRPLVELRHRLPEEPGGGRLLAVPLPSLPRRQARRRFAAAASVLLQLGRARLLPEHVRQHPVHGLHRHPQVPEDRPPFGESSPAIGAGGSRHLGGHVARPPRRGGRLRHPVAGRSGGSCAADRRRRQLRRPPKRTAQAPLQGGARLLRRRLPAGPAGAALLLRQHLPQAGGGAAAAGGVLHRPQAAQVPQEHPGPGERLLRVLRALPPGAPALRRAQAVRLLGQAGFFLPEGRRRRRVGPQRLPGPAHLLPVLRRLPGAARPRPRARLRRTDERRPNAEEDVRPPVKWFLDLNVAWFL